MRVEHDGEYAAVASLGGRPSTPSGTTTSSRTRRSSCRTAPRSRTWSPARLTGDEKAVWWERAVEAYPDYADYQRRTDREIPVFLLSPV